MSNNNNIKSIQCKWPYKPCHNRTRKSSFCYDHLKEFGFEIRPSNIINSQGQSIGDGLFAIREFLDGETIDYYHGKVWSWSDHVHDRIPDNNYLLAVYKKGVIDGSDPTSCISRFINHTSKEFRNCELSPEAEGKGSALRIPVVTTRYINAGEEFYTSYGNSFFDKDFQLFDPPIIPGIPNPVNNNNKNKKKRKQSEIIVISDSEEEQEEKPKKWFIDLLMEAEAEMKAEKEKAKLEKQKLILQHYATLQNNSLKKIQQKDQYNQINYLNKTKTQNNSNNKFLQAEEKSLHLIDLNQQAELNNSNSYDPNLDPELKEINYNKIKNNRALCRNCDLVKTKPYFAPFTPCHHCTYCLPCVQLLQLRECPICKVLGRKTIISLQWKKEHDVTKDDNKYKTNDGSTSIL